MAPLDRAPFDAVQARGVPVNEYENLLCGAVTARLTLKMPAVDIQPVEAAPLAGVIVGLA